MEAGSLRYKKGRAMERAAMVVASVGLAGEAQVSMKVCRSKGPGICPPTSYLTKEHTNMETILGIAIIFLAAVIALRLLAAFAKIAIVLAIIALPAVWLMQPARTGAVVTAVGHQALHILKQVVG